MPDKKSSRGRNKAEAGAKRAGHLVSTLPAPRSRFRSLRPTGDKPDVSAQVGARDSPSFKPTLCCTVMHSDHRCPDGRGDNRLLSDSRVSQRRRSSGHADSITEMRGRPCHIRVRAYTRDIAVGRPNSQGRAPQCDPIVSVPRRSEHSITPQFTRLFGCLSSHAVTAPTAPARTRT